jgi:hypothetical protein
MATTKPENWLDYKHPDFAALCARWVFTTDYYTGDVADTTRVKAYLVKRQQGESLKAYEERCQLADYTNHFATVVDSLAGMLFGVESDASRTYLREGKGLLGSEEDPGSVVNQLKVDADGRGNGMATVLKTLCTELITLHRAWLVVDTDAKGNPLVRVFPATAVPNWVCDASGNLVEVLVKEESDLRQGIQAKPEPTCRYTVFSLGGWQKWETDRNGNPVQVQGEYGSGAYSYVDQRGFPALPIFKVELPLRRMVGWQLARKAHVIFNKESERDWLLRVCNTPKLNIVATDDEFATIKKELADGGNAIQNNPQHTGQHAYIAPASGPAEISTKVLENKRDEFYVTGFREYGDAARERTATEVRQDVGAGVAAFLQLLKSAMDDGENGVLWRLEQLLNPGAKDQHFIAHVERSDDFVPVDVNMAIERTRSRFFGENAIIPMGRRAQIAAARRIAEWEGIEVTEEEVAAAVDAFNADRLLQLQAVLPIPAEALVQMTMAYLATTGTVDPDAEVAMAGGGKKKLVQLILDQCRELADSQVQARLRESQSFPGPQPMQDGPPDPAEGDPQPVAA